MQCSVGQACCDRGRGLECRTGTDASQVIEVAGDYPPEASSVISGVVLLKSLAHKRMVSSAAHPRILLLAGALESNPAALSSLHSVLQEVSLWMGGANLVGVSQHTARRCTTALALPCVQEEGHLRKAVEDIASLQPKVVVVEKNVPRLALVGDGTRIPCVSARRLHQDPVQSCHGWMVERLPCIS